MIDFTGFAKAFPPDETYRFTIAADELAQDCATRFGIEVPQDIKDFWSSVGAGYFGDRLLYVFGDGKHEEPRDSIVTWNAQDFWRDVYPEPASGGPFFFAETCFGEQLGFRYESARLIPIVFVVDTFESFAIGDSLRTVFEQVLSDRFAIIDPQRYESARGALGSLKPGCHYAPILSPLVGGSDDPGNFHFETAKVHFRTSVATYKAEASFGR